MTHLPPELATFAQLLDAQPEPVTEREAEVVATLRELLDEEQP